MPAMRNAFFLPDFPDMAYQSRIPLNTSRTTLPMAVAEISSSRLDLVIPNLQRSPITPGLHANRSGRWSHWAKILSVSLAVIERHLVYCVDEQVMPVAFLLFRGGYRNKPNSSVAELNA
jgi:hypothetical protein